MQWDIIAEFFAVFLGVSLSLFVADFRDRKSERRNVRRALLGIREDVAAEIPMVEWLTKIYAPTASAATELHREWHRIIDNPEKAESVFTALHLGATIAPARAYYETAKSAGTLGLLEDGKLQGAIASVFEQQQAYLKGLNATSVEHDFEFMRALQPYIRYLQGRIERIDTYVIGGQAELEFTVAVLPHKVEDLSRDDVVRNRLYRMALFRDYFAKLLIGYARALGELDTALEQALASRTLGT